MENNLFVPIATLLLAIIGFFLKRILDKVDKIDKIESDLADIKPKVQIMWEIIIYWVKGNDIPESLKQKLK